MLTNLGVLGHSNTIAMLPRAAAKPLVEAGSLYELPVDENIPFGTIGYSIRGERKPTPSGSAFIKALEEIAAQIVANG